MAALVIISYILLIQLKVFKIDANQQSHRGKCMDSIPRKNRDIVGLRLCENITSMFPAFCYGNLSSFIIDLKVDQDFLIDYCKLPFRNDKASLLCFKTTMDTISQPKYRISKEIRKDSFILISQSCRNAMLSKPTEICIKEMIDLTQSKQSQGFEISLKDLVNYCTSYTLPPSIQDDDTYHDTERTEVQKGIAIQNSKLVSSLSFCYNSSKYIKLNTGKLLTPQQRLDLCKYIPVDFYRQYSSDATSSTSSPSAVSSDFDQLMTSKGPVACVDLLIQRTSKTLLSKAIPPEIMISTCNQANEQFTGPVDCLIFAYSRPSNRKSDEIDNYELCHKSSGQYPVECFGKVERLLGRNASIELCRGASDEIRALCAINAPSYLNQTEKVTLCHSSSGSSSSIANTPIPALACLQTLYLSCTRISSLLYSDSNRASLSVIEAQNAFRLPLLQLCSGTNDGYDSTGTNENVYATSSGRHVSVVRGECIRRVLCDTTRPIHTNPKYNTFEFVLSVCSNAWIENAVSLVLSCMDKISPTSVMESSGSTGINPLQLDTNMAQHVCSHVQSAEDVTYVKECVIKLLKSKVVFSHSEIIKLCGHHSKSGGSVSANPTVSSTTSVIECITAAQRHDLSGFPIYKTYVNSNTLSKVCWPSVTDADMVLLLKPYRNSTMSGACLMGLVSGLTTAGNTFVAIEEKAAIYLCRYYPEILKPIMQCLKHRSPYNSRQMSWHEIKLCESVRSEASAVKVIRAVGKMGEPFVTAGEMFHIHFQVLDQFGRDLVILSKHRYFNTSVSVGGSYEVEEENEVWLSCSLQNNDKDDDGGNFDTVIWDHKPAQASPNGTVHVALTISKPGNIRLTVTAYIKTSRRIIGSDDMPVTISSRPVLGIFSLKVHENPQRKYDAQCLFIFYHGSCSLIDSGFSDTVHSIIRGNFYIVLSCMDVWLRWGVYVAGSNQNPHTETDAETLTGTDMNDSVSGESDIMTQQEENTNRNHTTRSTFLNNSLATSFSFASPLLGNIYYSLSYRRGIDIIWTGHGLPNDAMTAQQVLGLPYNFPVISLTTSASEGITIKTTADALLAATRNKKSHYKTNERTLKKAYYEMSKLWHPDRWGKHPNYISVVQTAFYYVNLAYESLMMDLELSKK